VAGRRVVGTVGGVYGDTVVRVEYSRLGPKHRLRAWAQLLALTTARPDASWTAVTIGRDRRSGVARSVLGPVDVAMAGEHLAALVELRARGLRAPLPLATKTSEAYAAKRGEGVTAANAQQLARREWANTRYDGEQADPAHRLVWGDAAPLEVMLAEKVTDDEQPVGWLGDEPHRFGALARRLWEPLRTAEKLALSS
jgi:exodeoxyribonuclease V gamma subunit